MFISMPMRMSPLPLRLCEHGWVGRVQVKLQCERGQEYLYIENLGWSRLRANVRWWSPRGGDYPMKGGAAVHAWRTWPR